MKDFEKTHEIKGKNFLFIVEASKDYRDYQKYEDLRNKIWGEPNDTLPGARNMMCENFRYINPICVGKDITIFSIINYPINGIIVR